MSDTDKAVIEALRQRVEFLEGISCETCIVLPTCPIYQAAKKMRARNITSNQFGCNWYYHAEPATRGAL
jgi:hypothetical protein